MSASARFASVCLILVCIIGFDPLGVAQQQLLNRPRQWFEKTAQAGSVGGTDHVALGWDDIYLGDRAALADVSFYYQKALNEFRYQAEVTLSRARASGAIANLQQALAVALGFAALESPSRLNYPVGTLSLYRDLIRVSPQAPVLYIHFAVYLEARGLLPEAIDQVRIALRLRYSDAILHRYLASLYAKNSEPEGAAQEEHISQQLRSTTPTIPEAELDTLFPLRSKPRF